MYWLPKMPKREIPEIPKRHQIGATFIVALTNCSLNPLFDIISKIFEMISNTVES